MPRAPSGAAVPTTEAFDLWLRCSLREAYDEVAAEAVPDALLKLLDRSDEERLP